MRAPLLHINCEIACHKASIIPKAAAKTAKAQVTELARKHLQNFPITIQRTSYINKKGQSVERLGAFTNAGNLLGLITLKFALTADGNVRSVWKMTQQESFNNLTEQ